jgi:putative restriction endonuclease
VRKDVLEEIDGPMLKHGIQEMDGNKLLLPTRKLDYPDKQRLKFRFEKFKKAC